MLHGTGLIKKKEKQFTFCSIVGKTVIYLFDGNVD